MVDNLTEKERVDRALKARSHLEKVGLPVPIDPSVLLIDELYEEKIFKEALKFHRSNPLSASSKKTESPLASYLADLYATYRLKKAKEDREKDTGCCPVM